MKKISFIQLALVYLLAPFFYVVAKYYHGKNYIRQTVIKALAERLVKTAEVEYR